MEKSKIKIKPIPSKISKKLSSRRSTEDLEREDVDAKFEEVKPANPSYSPEFTQSSVQDLVAGASSSEPVFFNPLTRNLEKPKGAYKSKFLIIGNQVVPKVTIVSNRASLEDISKNIFEIAPGSTFGELFIIKPAIVKNENGKYKVVEKGIISTESSSNNTSSPLQEKSLEKELIVPEPTTPTASNDPEIQVSNVTNSEPEPTPEEKEAAEAQRQQEETERLQREAAEEQIRQDTEKLSKEERENLAKGFHNIGFRIERWKNNLFAETFDRLDRLSQTKIKDGDGKEKLKQKNGFVANLVRATRNSFKANAEMAEKKILAGKNPPGLTKLSNVAYLAKNFLRPYGIFIMSSTGITPANVRKVIMLGGMAAGRAAGITKEAILSSDKVLDQTQFSSSEEDINAAQDEAEKIYELARIKAGKGGTKKEVSAEELKKAYLSSIPKDLQERLKKNPDTASVFKKDIFRIHLEFDINKLNKDIKNIEQDYRFTPEKKEELREQLLRRWEKRLTDYDRILTRIGTIEQYSAWASYTEAGAKNVVRGMTAMTATTLAENTYTNLGKVWDWFSHTNYESMANSIASAAHAQTPTPTPEISTANTAQSSFSLRVGENQPKFGQAKLDEHFFTEKIKPAFKLNLDSQTPVQVKMPEALHAVSVEQDAVVEQGEGVEHALIRQIRHNFELAKKLGYEGKEGDTKALEKFAGVEAHKIAIARGYVDKFTGEEIHVKKAGEVAYKLIPGDGKDNYKVEEFHKEGDKFIFQEVHEKMADGTETKFEGKDANDYESVAPKYVAPTHEHAVPEHTAAQTTKTNEGSLINPDQEKYYRDRGYTGPMKIEDINAWEHAQKIKALESDIHDKFETPTPEKPVETTKAPELLKDFQKNPFSLRTAKLFDAQNTYLRNFAKLFPENTEDYIKSMHKLDFKELTTRTSSENNFVQYLNKIQEVTKLKPKIGFFHMFNKEKVGEYIVRALQYAAKKGDMLEKLKIQN